MATITTIDADDLISGSRTDINNNFANLNSDKIETSVLDTDNTLSANSDAKIPSQKAVKAYADTQGNVNASETTKGIVEEATDAEVAAGTATGATGAKLFVSAQKLKTFAPETTSNKDTTVTLGTSDTKYPSQKAVKTYVDGNPTSFKTGNFTRAINGASGAVTYAHGLGRTPKFVKITAEMVGGSTAYELWQSFGTFDGTNNQCLYSMVAGGNSSSSLVLDTTNGVYIIGPNGSQAGVITVDATNITITWTSTYAGGSGNIYAIWEAQ
jgi:hypothetical protein